MLYFIFSSNTYAYELFGGKYRNPNSLKYWIDSSVIQAGYEARAVYGSEAFDSSSLIGTMIPKLTTNGGLVRGTWVLSLPIASTIM